jgi:dTDP-glucose 4,6-dehydratase
MLCGILHELAPRGDGCAYADQIKVVGDRPDHDLRYAIDAGKISAELGWQPLERSDTGFRKTVQWYRDNREWWQRILSGEYGLSRLGIGVAATTC